MKGDENPFARFCLELENWDVGHEWLMAHLSREPALSKISTYCYTEEDDLLHGSIQLGGMVVAHFKGWRGDECESLALDWMRWHIRNKPDETTTIYDELYVDAYEAHESATVTAKHQTGKILHRAWRRIFREDVGYKIHPEDFGVWLVLRAYARKHKGMGNDFSGVEELLGQVL